MDVLASIKANTHLASTSEQHLNVHHIANYSARLQVDMAKGKWTKLLDFLKLQQKEQS